MTGAELGVIVGAVSAAMGALGTMIGIVAKVYVDRRRVDTVEAPTAQADAWQQVFEITSRQLTDLHTEVGRLQQRLDDQDHEHRVEREEWSTRELTLRAGIDQATASVRSLRSYVVILQAVLDEHRVAYPPMPVDEVVAPERRSPVVSVDAGSIHIDPKG